MFPLIGASLAMRHLRLSDDDDDDYCIYVPMTRGRAIVLALGATAVLAMFCFVVAFAP